MHTASGSISTHRQQGVLTITFSHPAHNAMPSPLLAQLAAAIENAGVDEDVRVIVLRSGGDRTFCAGASFDELLAIQDEVGGKAFFMGFARVINACRKVPKLILGRVQGRAVGGGVGLAAACDHCLATRHASIRLSELAIGIGPFVIGPAVERKIGLAAFSQLSLTPTRWRSAAWAQEKGLFAEVLEDQAALDEAVAALAEQLATYSLPAMSALKTMYWQGTAHWDSLLEERAHTSGRLVLGAACKQALAAFRNKR